MSQVASEAANEEAAVELMRSQALSDDFLFDRMVMDNADIIERIWEEGDGEGGGMLCRVAALLGLKHWSRIPRNVVSIRGGKVAQKKRWAVFKRDGYRCRNCSAEHDLTVDHIHPRSKGGTNNLDNLQTLCARCNSAKGNRT